MDIAETTVVIPVCLKIGILDKIETNRGNQNRSAYIRDILSTYFDALGDVEAEV